LPPPPNPETEDPFNEGPVGPLVMPALTKFQLPANRGMNYPARATAGLPGHGRGPGKYVGCGPRGAGRVSAEVARLQRAVTGALEAANALKPRLAAIRRALLETPSAGETLLADATDAGQAYE